jgi:hypothetical protein
MNESGLESLHRKQMKPGEDVAGFFVVRGWGGAFIMPALWKRILIVVLIGEAIAGGLLVSKLRHEARHVSGFIEAHEIRVGSRVGGRIKSVAAALLASRKAEWERLSRGYRAEEIAQFEARKIRRSRAWRCLKRGRGIGGKIPVHVVYAWIGNDVRVAKKHSLQVTDEDLSRHPAMDPDRRRKKRRSNKRSKVKRREKWGVQKINKHRYFCKFAGF